MKKCILIALALPLLAFGPARPGNPMQMGMKQAAPPQLIVNNRILAKVNEKAISVLDVKKQMDMVFARQYPEYNHSDMARYQFYQASWRQALSELVDKELILLEARHIKLPVEKAEVREEMEKLFGPNVMQKLARMNLTYDEAWKLVHDELLFKRMVSFRVNTKAMQEVGPMTVKNAYRKLSEGQEAQKTWSYQVLSIRAKHDEHLETAAKLAKDLLDRHPDDLTQLFHNLERAHLPDDVAFTLSTPYHLDSDKISSAHREALDPLTPGEFSHPLAQVNRRDKKPVYRIFQLIDMEETAPPSFAEASKSIENQLYSEAIASQTDHYIQSLRDRYHVAEDLKRLAPANFQPFALN